MLCENNQESTELLKEIRDDYYNMNEKTIEFDNPALANLSPEFAEVLRGIYPKANENNEYIHANDRQTNDNQPSLSEAILNVIWDQFCMQIGVTDGKEFIKENNGLTLDLRDDAHIQTTANFVKGKFAKHNTKVNYAQRYHFWKSQFKKNAANEILTTRDRITGKVQWVILKSARKEYDAGRPKGNKGKNIQIDHTISVGEMIRNPRVAAHLTQQERVKFANSEMNLNELDAAANSSKRDNEMTTWLDSKRNGQTPAERFPNIDEPALRKKDAEARKKYEQVLEEGEKRSKEQGRQSQKEESRRMMSAAGKALLMRLFAELVKKIVQNLIIWFKSAKRKLSTFIDRIIDAVTSFFYNIKDTIKEILFGEVETLLTTIITAIVGPLIDVFKKAWLLIKQGRRSLKEIISYMRNPENKTKPKAVRIAQVGKMVVIAASAVGAIVLGETIGTSLMNFPPLLLEIPSLGNLATLIGTFMGAVAPGILGAIVIFYIDKYIAKRVKRESDAMFTSVS